MTGRLAYRSLKTLVDAVVTRFVSISTFNVRIGSLEIVNVTLTVRSPPLSDSHQLSHQMTAQVL